MVVEGGRARERVEEGVKRGGGGGERCRKGVRGGGERISPCLGEGEEKEPPLRLVEPGRPGRARLERAVSHLDPA